MSLLKGLEGLKHLVRQEQSRFQSAPVLLVSNSVNLTASTPRSRSRHAKYQASAEQVSNACERVQILLQQQLSIRCISIEQVYPFPSFDQVQQAQGLAKKFSAGDFVVVGVGSGAALDLAKALWYHRKKKKNKEYHNNSNDESDNNTKLILIPSTYSAVMVAGNPYSSLLLDPEEATLVSVHHPGSSRPIHEEDPTPPHTTNNNNHNTHNIDIVQLELEPTYLCHEQLHVTLLAALSLLLDSLRIAGNKNKDSEVDDAMNRLSRLLACIDNDNLRMKRYGPGLTTASLMDEPTSHQLWELLLEIGHIYLRPPGYDHHNLPVGRRRLAPLALAASLSPIAQCMVTELMAATVPSLLQNTQVKNRLPPNVSDRILAMEPPPLPSSLQEAALKSSSSSPSSSFLLDDFHSVLKANRALQQIQDDDEVFVNDLLSEIVKAAR